MPPKEPLPGVVSSLNFLRAASPFAGGSETVAQGRKPTIAPVRGASPAGGLAEVETFVTVFLARGYKLQ